MILLGSNLSLLVFVVGIVVFHFTELLVKVRVGQLQLGNPHGLEHLQRLLGQPTLATISQSLPKESR